ncbi:MAG: ABC transporter substrate-binding protein [Monoglobaceae bacterium]
MRNRRYFIWILTILTVVLAISFILFIGVNDNYDVSENTEETVQIRMLINWNGDSAKSEILNSALNEYTEENKNVEIIKEYMTGSNFYIKLMSDFASGYQPDIICMQPGRETEKLFDNKKLISFDEALKNDEKWYKSLDKSILRYVTHNDSIYGIPTEIEFICLYINKDIFDKFGISVPNTYDELKTAIIRLKSEGVIPMAFAGNDSDLLLYQAIVASIGGNIEIEDSISSGIAGPAYTDAFSYIKELYSMGAFNEDALTCNRNTAAQLFLDKKAAMIAETSDFASRIENSGKGNVILNPGQNVEMIAFPCVDNRVNIVTMPFGVGGATYFISADADERSMDIVKMLSSSETVLKFADSAKAMMRLNTDSVTLPKTGLSMKREVLLMGAGELTEKPLDIYYKNIGNEYYKDVILGRRNADEVLDLLSESWMDSYEDKTQK